MPACLSWPVRGKQADAGLPFVCPLLRGADCAVFTIYGVVVELLAHYTAPAEADQGKILALCAITFGAALVYGVCAYASSAISHTAA